MRTLLLLFVFVLCACVACSVSISLKREIKSDKQGDEQEGNGHPTGIKTTAK